MCVCGGGGVACVRACVRVCSRAACACVCVRACVHAVVCVFACLACVRVLTSINVKQSYLVAYMKQRAVAW